MGNAIIFAKAFRECGIGGRFSKFQIVQSNDWFELINIDTVEESRFCYHTYDKLDNRKYRQVSAGEALQLHRSDPQWATHFQTAQKVIAKIVSRGNNRSENRYFVDDLHQSVFVTNRMFVIEVTPVLRQVPEVTTTSVYDFLEDYCTPEMSNTADVKVLSRYGKIIVCVSGGHMFNSLLTADEFNEQYGVIEV